MVDQNHWHDESSVSIPYRQCLSLSNNFSFQIGTAMFQFLIGNVLAQTTNGHISKQQTVSIPYRQCLSRINELYPYKIKLWVSIPYRQCLSPGVTPMASAAEAGFQFLIGNVLACFISGHHR